MNAARAGMLERYRRAYVPKAREVEELVDYYWHRPLAAWLTVVLERTPVSPLQLTLASLVTGLGSAGLVVVAAWRPEPVWLAGAAVALFVSVILDCADGQLARLRGEASELGRILDGIADNVVVGALAIALTFTLTVRCGPVWGIAAALAWITMPLRLMTYDRLRALFLGARSSPDPAAEGIGSIESVAARLARAEQAGQRGTALALRLYLGYCRTQRSLIPDPPSPQPRDAGLVDARWMRTGSYLGLGTHLMIQYVSLLVASVAFASLLVQQLVFLVLLNVVLGRVVLHARRCVGG